MTFDKIKLTKTIGEVTTVIEVECSGIRCVEDMLCIVHALSRSPDEYPAIVEGLLAVRRKVAADLEAISKKARIV